MFVWWFEYRFLFIVVLVRSLVPPLKGVLGGNRSLGWVPGTDGTDGTVSLDPSVILLDHRFRYRFPIGARLSVPASSESTSYPQDIWNR